MSSQIARGNGHLGRHVVGKTAAPNQSLDTLRYVGYDVLITKKD
jgi:hypothetical protein